jgi:hypothetical protein
LKTVVWKPIGTPRMSRALDIDLGRNKAAAITVFDATVTVTSQFAMHLGKECIKFAHGGLLITSEINVDLVRHCEVFRLVWKQHSRSIWKGVVTNVEQSPPPSELNFSKGCR